MRAASKKRVLERMYPEDMCRAASYFSPLDFMRYASRGRYHMAKHLLLINQKLLEVLSGRILRLMVFMPPRHGKSTLISEHFPCVFLGRNPDKRVILTSYEAQYAATWGRKARSLMEEHGHEIWEARVNPVSSAADRWDLCDHRGGMMTAGVGGPLTGKGADLLIIDDPVKNDVEAWSKVYRERAWDWFNATAITRLEPGGAVVFMMTRWHEDDLAGRIIRSGGPRWEVISLPAVAEAEDPIGREPGEALWPERWPLEALDQPSKISWVWAAEYQQRPAPDAGVIFKRDMFCYYTNSGGIYKLQTNSEDQKHLECEKCWLFTTVDLAASTKQTADYTVASTWAVGPGNELLLLDRQRQRLEGPDQVPLLWTIWNKYRPSYFAIEQAGYQLALIQAASREGLPVRAVKVDKDKVARALPAAARIEMGQVFFPDGVSWLNEFESELLSFPSAEHDDQVDTLSMAVHEVTLRKVPHIRRVI